LDKEGDKMVEKKVEEKLPPWLKEFKRRTSLIDVISKAFELGCDCEVCRDLRKISYDLGEFFIPEKKKE
jgi:hypothetical protein